MVVPNVVLVTTLIYWLKLSIALKPIKPNEWLRRWTVTYPKIIIPEYTRALLI